MHVVQARNQCTALTVDDDRFLGRPRHRQPARIGLKWPNDIVVADGVVADGGGLRKLGGILVEGGGEHAGPARAVIGIGLNVRMPEAAAVDIDQPWTDLRALLDPPPPRDERPPRAATPVAPQDKQRASARINWLLRQLPKDDAEGLHIRAQWPGASPWTQLSLKDALADSSPLYADKGNMALLGFEIVSVIDLGQRFSQRQTFIKELEEAVPDFWERVGQNLQAWVKPAPRVKEERSEPEAVSPSALSD